MSWNEITNHGHGGSSSANFDSPLDWILKIMHTHRQTHIIIMLMFDELIIYDC